MPIDFACKCGKSLRAQDDHAGRKVQCPGCGRMLEIPRPADRELETRWVIQEGPGIAQRAESAGVVRQGLAHVIALHGAGELQAHLRVAGVLTCWYCRTGMPYSGQVFGRGGLAGEFVAVNCAECNARLWTGFSNHQVESGTTIYLYAPSHARQYTKKEGDKLPIPTFHVESVTEEPAPVATAELRDWLDTTLSSLVQAISRRESYQLVKSGAVPLVGRPLPRELWELACRTLRALLEKETATHMRAILTEALAALRDPSAAKAVAGAVKRSLEQEDPADGSNLPLQDLCVMAMLFGNRNGISTALDRGMRSLPTPTRAWKLDKRLTPKEIDQMLRVERSFDAYEGVLGGDSWQRIIPLLPLWEAMPDTEEGNWLQKLFGRGK